MLVTLHFFFLKLGGLDKAAVKSIVGGSWVSPFLLVWSLPDVNWRNVLDVEPLVSQAK